MSDGKRFEDNVSVEDLMKRPQKELLAEIYIQTLKTNGTVTQHSTEIVDLKKEMKDKIGMKLFGLLTGIIAFLIIIFNVLDLVIK